jgi:RNA 2',3'-cyclic 3'-phosphodiesterase
MSPPPAPSTLRLFIGLWPDASVRDTLQARSDAWSWPASARRTRTERLHVTLHFLGPVAADRLEEVKDGLRVQWQGWELVLDRGTVWPGGIAVLEAGHVPATLAELHQALAGKLRALELPVEERPFRPHVTLARKASGARPPSEFAPVHWRAGPQVLLVQSLPGGTGYEPLASLVTA